MSESGYLLSNVRSESKDRFIGLEGAFDRVTIGHLERLGVARGWQCLELGAGGGSVARWLAGRVGSEGRVIATDLDPQWVTSGDQENLEIIRHDLVHDPLPLGPWDLIHERLVLLHVRERLDVLDRLVAALAPAGWLLIEDFDTSEQRVADPEGPNTPLVTKVLAGFRELLRQRGAVSCFAAGALRHLLERGLSETGASGYVAMGGGGSAMAGVLKANALQVREGLLTVGITPAEFDAYLAALDNPHVIIGSPVLISAWGRRS